MDYCHSCRRHLNGAFVCPGCGTPADQLRADADDNDTGDAGESFREGARERDGAGSQPEPGGRAARRREQGRGGRRRGRYEAGRPDAGPSGEPGRRAGEAEPADGHGFEPEHDERDHWADGAGPSDGPGYPTDDTGRTEGAKYDDADDEYDEYDPAEPDHEPVVSRRDRKAAAHRRRRRRTLLIATGFVLAAGGLSLAELGVDAPGFSSEQPAAAVDPSTRGGASDGASASVSARTRDSAATPTVSAQASRSAAAAASKSPSAGASRSTAPADGNSTSLASAAPTGSSSSAAAPTADPSASAEPTSADPAPDPTPSETCSQFLWWCT
ncbi:SCO2400 family protein [Streptomyces adustus]|uniref:SCO2400 family protein n=1 Tax=Streptomyces adustus TaxID=1609272 RepID=UPI00192E4BC5|nr:hypothetical protein [Streptomyces adustus]